MTYSEDTLKKIKTFGALQYTPEQIMVILRITNQEQFLTDLENPETLLSSMYQSGLLSGKYNQDIQLFQISEIEIKMKKEELAQIETEAQLYKELFSL